MAPWEEIPYFQTPSLVLINVGAGGSAQLFKNDPLRVGFIVSCPNQVTNGLFVSPNPNINTSPPPNSEGLPINTNIGPLFLRQKDWGPLVTLEWWVANSNAAAVTVSLIELKLYKWPQKRQKENTDAWLSRFIRSIWKSRGQSRNPFAESKPTADNLFSAYGRGRNTLE